MDAFDLNSFDENKNYVITASAGTGKTFNIVEIVSKLIDRGIPLDKILIVTYTEKAAGELKNKIRKRVGTAQNVDGASIGTIHSFCQQTIDEFFISAGKPSRQKLIDESAAQSFLKQYIRSGKIYEEIQLLKKTQLKVVDIKIEDVADEVFRNYPQPKRGRQVSWESCKDKVEKFVKGILTKSVENTVYQKISAFLSKYYLDGKSQEVPSIVCFEEEKFSAYELLLDGYNKYGTNTFPELAVQLLEKNNLATYGEGKCIDILISDIVLRYAKDAYKQWQLEKAKYNEQTYADMLRNVREEVVSERPLLKKLQDKYDYAIIDEFQDTNQIQWDIFRKVFLESPDHHITVVGDPKQSIYAFQGADLEVFRKATDDIEKAGGIKCELKKNYRSTETMIKAVNEFFGNGSKALTTPNTFSSSEVGNPEFEVTYNGDSTQAFWIGVKNGGSAPEYVEQEEYAKIVCQTIIDCCSPDGKDGTKLRIRVEKKTAKGKTSYDWRNVTFSDFAILARTRTEIGPITKALEKAGIPYQKYKDTALFQGTECAQWIQMLSAIAMPDFSSTNRNFFKKALFTDFFGYSLQDLKDVRFEKDDISEIRQFNHWKTLAEKREWENLIDSIVYKTDLCKNLGTLDQLKSLGAFKQLGEYCIAFLSVTPSIDELILDLTRRHESSEDADEDEGENDDTVARNTDFDSVKLMTIHASKGLEFPIVISVAGFKGVRPSETVYSYHDAAGKRLSFIKDQAYEAEMVQEWQRLYYVAYTRAKYVLVLPFYEPLKGQSQSMAFISESINDYIKASFGYRPLEDDGTTFDDMRSATAGILAGIQRGTGETTEDKQKDVLKEMLRTQSCHKTRKYSYSVLTHPHKESEDAVNEVGVKHDQEDFEDGEEPANEETKNSVQKNAAVSDIAGYDPSPNVIPCTYAADLKPAGQSETFPAGADLGNALHDIFEVIDYTQDWCDAQNGDELDKTVVKCFSDYGFNIRPEWLSDVKVMVENVLGAALPLIRGSKKQDGTISLRQISFADRKNEVEFNFNKDNERLKNYFNGFIDLVFRQGEVYSVLDWKSDRENEEFCFTDQESVKRHVDEHYAIQRVLYSYCLINWLKNFYGGDEQKIFEEHFGGVYYVFLRGCIKGSGNGVYAQTWESYADLKAAYDKIVAERVKTEDTNEQSGSL